MILEFEEQCLERPLDREAQRHLGSQRLRHDDLSVPTKL